jgi:hypothetical protein
MLIHRPQLAAPVLTYDFGLAKSSCGKKDALVQSELQAPKDGIDSELDKLLA